MKKFLWLKKDGQAKVCCVCNIHIVSGLAHLSRHDSTENHKKKVNAAKTTPKIQTFLKTAVKSPTKESARKLELMVSAFVAEHNIPFAALEHLNSIIKYGVHDSEVVKQFNINRKKDSKL